MKTLPSDLLMSTFTPILIRPKTSPSSFMVMMMLVLVLSQKSKVKKDQSTSPPNSLTQFQIKVFSNFKFLFPKNNFFLQMNFHFWNLALHRHTARTALVGPRRAQLVLTKDCQIFLLPRINPKQIWEKLKLTLHDGMI